MQNAEDALVNICNPKRHEFSLFLEGTTGPLKQFCFAFNIILIW